MMKLCECCKEKPVKSPRYKACSRSCGSILRWEKFKRSGGVINFNKQSEIARRAAQSVRLKAEIIRERQDLGIGYCVAVAKLYVRARNRGYRNGFYTRDKRARMEA